jgi:ABC-2 family transporter
VGNPFNLHGITESTMRGVLTQILLGIRLNSRNRMALIYGYLFPAMFLLAFRTLYRQEKIPLWAHAGELLTVTVLGGACFGLPTGIVSERERGVWRRYKTLPVSALGILGGTLVTRYLLLLTAGLVQLGLALASGMPLPQHPFELWVAFTAASIAFIGIGLDIAMLAPNVPAVQALGQCIFLPMLIIGGVAVPLTTLPSWARTVSAFLPGRYSVGAMQACVSGTGLGGARFDVLALLTIGLAGAASGILAFRWDSRQRPSPWISAAALGWLIVGFTAAARGHVHNETLERGEQRQATEFLSENKAELPLTTDSGKTPLPAATARSGSLPAGSPPKDAASWRQVTQADIDGVAFERLPPDRGVVAPIAAPGEQPDATIVEQLGQIQGALPIWGPGRIADPVQRVRNYLYAASVADIYQMDPLERFVPLLVFDQIQRSIPAENLPRILYWIALHPLAGSDSAAGSLHELALPDGPPDTLLLRNRVMIYAFKLLGRLNAVSAKN